jgi:hypothetical protein
MGIRTPNSKVITGDTVKIASAGFQVPLWAVGMEGTVERIGREGGVIVNLGYRAKRKFITAKQEQVILVRGINFIPGGKVYDEQGNYRRERRKVKRNANT